MNNAPQSHYELVAVNQIVLDLENPRIKKWLEMYGENPSAEDIALALGAGSGQEGEGGGPSYMALRQSILTNGGIIHPVIINRDSGGRLVVIEGNTRVQMYREFAQERLSGNWSAIPAMVYEDLSSTIIDAIRLQAHLVGVRQWDPYSKGKYLHHLYNSDHLTLDQIVDFCGGNKREVLNYIRAYTDMEKHYVPLLESSSDFDPQRFSAFVELQAPRVQDALRKSGYDKSDFAQWVQERKLFPLNTVRDLPRMLQNPESRKVFLKSGAREAQRLLDVPPAEAGLRDASLEQLASELCRRINGYNFEDLQRLKADPDCDEVAILLAAKDRIDDFCEYVCGEKVQ